MAAHSRIVTRARPNRWTWKLRKRISALERQLEDADNRGAEECCEKLRGQIERLVPAAPFATRDILTHEMFEHSHYCLLRAYGQSYWCGLIRGTRRMRHHSENYFKSVESAYSRSPERARRQVERVLRRNRDLEDSLRTTRADSADLPSASTLGLAPELD